MAVTNRRKQAEATPDFKQQTDNLSGQYMDLPELIRDGSFQRKAHRDKYTLENRIEEWEETESLYHENRDNPLPPDLEELHLPEYGIHQVAGDMGFGKTLWCAYVARHFRRRGWNVFSTAGFLFGQRLRAIEAYSFPDHVTEGGLVFADENHVLIDNYASNSIRNRSFGQSSTAMRKEQITCLGASANTRMVGMEYRGACESLVMPGRRYVETYRFPPFCYLYVRRVSGYPWARQDPLVEMMLNSGRKREIHIWNPDPIELYRSAMLMDSFESLRLGEQFDINSDAMRREREGRGNAQPQGAESLDDETLMYLALTRLFEAGLLPLDPNKRRGVFPMSALKALMDKHIQHSIAIGRMVAGVQLATEFQVTCTVNGFNQAEMHAWLLTKAQQGETA